MAEPVRDLMAALEKSLGIERCPVSVGVADNFTQDILMCGKRLPCPDHPQSGRADG